MMPLDPELVLAVACRQFGIGHHDLIGQRRHNHLVEARAFAVWVLRSLGRPLSYPKIGRALGGRDHCTVINLHQKAIGLRLSNPDFRAACAGIEERFYNTRIHADVQ